MFNQPYFIPNYYPNIAPSFMMRGATGINNAMRGAGIGTRALGGIGTGIKTATGAGRNLGLFSKLGNSITTLKGINWGGFINNASKTLGVINQTIPLVQQTKPLINNMKSMLKVASLFKDETDTTKTPISKKNLRNKNSISPNNYYQSNQTSQTNKHLNTLEKTINHDLKETHNNFNDYSPTFFISS